MWLRRRRDDAGRRNARTGIIAAAMATGVILIGIIEVFRRRRGAVSNVEAAPLVSIPPSMASAPELDPISAAPPLRGRYAEIVIRFRYVIVIGWVLVALWAALQPHTSLQRGGAGLRDLAPVDLPAVQTELRAFEAFPVPLRSRTLLVEHDSEGIDPAQQQAIVTRVDPRSVAGSGWPDLLGGIPIVNRPLIAGSDPPYQTTAVTYLIFDPATSAIAAQSAGDAPCSFAGDEWTRCRVDGRDPGADLDSPYAAGLASAAGVDHGRRDRGRRHGVLRKRRRSVAGAAHDRDCVPVVAGRARSLRPRLRTGRASRGRTAAGGAPARGRHGLHDLLPLRAARQNSRRGHEPRSHHRCGAANDSDRARGGAHRCRWVWLARLRAHAISSGRSEFHLRSPSSWPRRLH